MSERRGAVVGALDFDAVLEARDRHGWLILLGDEEKNPKICGKWGEIKDKGTQTRDELEALIARAGPKAHNWGPICGVGDLFSFDFDWAWIYGLWYDHFKDRADTLIYETPNKGARVFYYTKEKPAGDPFEASLHTEFKGNHYAVVGGEARDLNGDLKPYKCVVDVPIKRDDAIIRDTTAFFNELLAGHYAFLKYKCIRAHMASKWIVLNHAQGLAINTFMVLNGCDSWEIHNFRRALYDMKGERYTPEYSKSMTDSQIKSTRRFVEKGGRPNPCRPKTDDKTGKASTPLYEVFNFDLKNCEGCSRRRFEGESRAKKKTEGTRSSKEKPSQATRMVELALEQDALLFVDQYNNPYIRFSSSEIFKTQSLKSGAVKQWLAKLLYNAEKKAPGGEALNSALNVLKAMAREQPQLSLYNRVAPDGQGGVYIDMADPQWRAIHVTAKGWEIDLHPPPVFRRFTHQKALPVPVAGGNVKDILVFVNLKDQNHQIIFVVATVVALIPGIPHVVVNCYGPHGGGKSMAMEAMREVIDPSIVKLLRLPRNEKELVQQLYHHYCGFYDNIGRLPRWMSDVFCRAVTGTGNTKRMLYSDDDDIIYQYRRVCALNGINIPAERGDLLDRSVLMEFSLLDEKSRLEDRELNRMLTEKIPGILGGALDVLVKAMNIYPTLELKGLFRMADFTRWGYAIAEAIGYGGKKFLKAYRENVEMQSYESVKASVVAQVLLRFMKDKEEWSGAPEELYTFLQAQAEEMGISTRQKAWPKRSWVMTRRLNDISPSLPAAGYNYESDRTTKGRIIRIYSVGKTLGNSVKSDIATYGDADHDAIDAINGTSGSYSKDYTEFDERRRQYFKKMIGKTEISLPQNVVDDTLDLLKYHAGSMGRPFYLKEMKRRGHDLRMVSVWLADMEAAGLINTTKDTISLRREGGA